jgi:glycerol-3-phosphate acyltransferase PlsY
MLNILVKTGKLRRLFVCLSEIEIHNYLNSSLETNSTAVIFTPPYLSSIFSMVGHVLPVFAQFKGGKGVATSLGVLIGLQPFAALLCFLVFLLIFVFSKYVSLGAIISAMIYPFIVYYVDPKVLFHEMVFTVILSSAVIFTHRKNISRLLKGEENKMNLFKR